MEVPDRARQVPRHPRVVESGHLERRRLVGLDRQSKPNIRAALSVSTWCRCSLSRSLCARACAR
eukprot:8947114-Pyramimonas_sp.AAC.2